MRTITIYELLGLIKDGKAPKKILIKDKVYYLLVDEKHYIYSQSKDIRQWDLFIDEEIRISQNLDLEVTILDESYLENKPLEEKKIPEKLEEFGLIQYNLDYIDYKNIETLKEWLNKDFQTIYDTLDLLIKNQNKLIDYLKSKGE